MSVARVVKYLVGTSWTSGVTITNNSSTTGSEVDMFGNDTTDGHMRLWLVYTSGTAAGNLNVQLFPGPITGDEASSQAINIASPAVAATTQQIFLGDFPISRFMKGYVANASVGASVTNVSLVAEVFQQS